VKLGIAENDLDAWYKVDQKKLAAIGGEALLSKYGSMWGLLSTVYPERKWMAFRLGKVPYGYWNSLGNQRDFLEFIAPQVNVRPSELDGWYKVSTSTLIRLGAKGILNQYNCSLSKWLVAVYPKHPWDASKFSIRPHAYWQSLENQKKFMDELGKKIGIHSEADFDLWYEQPNSILKEHGGAGLADLYPRGLPKLLAAVYPNYNWQLWRFPRRISQILDSEEELNKLFLELEKVLNIRRPEDWYRVTAEQLTTLKVPSFYRGGGLAAVLSKRYPTVEWDEAAFFGRGFRRATQRWLTSMLTDLFPDDAILVDYSHPELKCQLDIFFPKHLLAFEYQGVQHYEQMGVYGDVSDRMTRDEGKASRCLTLGITLIAVPFWWNKKRPALLAAILAARPDLFATKLAPYLEDARRG